MGSEGEPGHPPAPRSTARVEEIKAAAAELFYERGYHKADLREIAARVGMHPSTFYNYFQAKNELLYLILNDGMDMTLRRFEEPVRKDQSAADALSGAVRLHVDVAAHARHGAWAIFAEAGRLSREYAGSVTGKRDEHRRRWMRIVDQGIEDGEFETPDDEVATRAIMDIIQDVARWHSPDSEFTPAIIEQEFLDLILYGIMAIPPMDAAPVADAPEERAGR